MPGFVRLFRVVHMLSIAPKRLGMAACACCSTNRATDEPRFASGGRGGANLAKIPHSRPIVDGRILSR